MIRGKGMPCFPLFKDNQGALQFSKNPVSNSNSKHVDVRHHFTRELVRQGKISVNDVRSRYQHADVLTNVLAFDFLATHRRFLMNLSDEWNLIWWIRKLMYVCVYVFSSVDTSGALYQSQKKGNNRIRGAVTKHLSDVHVLGS